MIRDGVKTGVSQPSLPDPGLGSAMEDARSSIP